MSSWRETFTSFSPFSCHDGNEDGTFSFLFPYSCGKKHAILLCSGSKRLLLSPLLTAILGGLFGRHFPFPREESRFSDRLITILEDGLLFLFLWCARAEVIRQGFFFSSLFHQGIRASTFSRRNFCPFPAPREAAVGGPFFSPFPGPITLSLEETKIKLFCPRGHCLLFSSLRLYSMNPLSLCRVDPDPTLIPDSGSFRSPYGGRPISTLFEGRIAVRRRIFVRFFSFPLCPGILLRPSFSQKELFPQTFHCVLSFSRLASKRGKTAPSLFFLPAKI